MAEDREMDDRQKALLMQLMGQHVEQLRQHRIMLERRYIELASAEQTLKELENAEKGREMLIPIGGGVFVRAHTADSGKSISEAGSDVGIMKSCSESLKNVAAEKKEAEEGMKNIENQMEEAAEKLREMGS